MTFTASEVRALPAVVDVVTAGQVLGIGRTVAYELVRTNRFPTPVLRVGRQIKIPTAYLIDLLALSTDARTSLPQPPGEA
jgi:predicted DNA-binding transcriptional regulator AlpA